MSITDEQIVAFVDGELNEQEAAQVSAAMAQDPDVASSIARYRKLKSELAGAFAPVAEELIPARLLAAAGMGPENVVALPTRSDKEVVPEIALQSESRPAFLKWGSLIAATLVVGLLIGQFAGRNRSDPDLIANVGPELVAQGRLAVALEQTHSGSPDSQIGIAFSFRNHTGDACRVFLLESEVDAAETGVACKNSGDWQVVALVATEAAGAETSQDYKPAGAVRPLPQSVADIIGGMIAGDPMGLSEEKSAMNEGWLPNE